MSEENANVAPEETAEPIVAVPEEPTEVQKAEQRNAELRAELARVTAEREADETKASEGVKLEALKAEEAQLVTELTYQNRLRAGRATATEGEIATPANEPLVPEGKIVSVTPSTGDTEVPQVPEAPSAPEAPATDAKGAKAPANGKGK